jgi:hypothetical protein
MNDKANPDSGPIAPAFAAALDRQHAPAPDYEPVTDDQRWWMYGDMGGLFTALALFQAGNTSAAKSGKNPHLKSKYADLSDVYAVSKQAAELGLAVSTFPIKSDERGECEIVAMLTYKDGSYIMTRFWLKPQKNDVQGWGGVFTYARRYATQMLLGIAADEDMDGEDTKKVVRRGRKAPVIGGNDGDLSQDGFSKAIKAAKNDGELRKLWKDVDAASYLSDDQRVILHDEIKEKRGQ